MIGLTLLDTSVYMGHARGCPSFSTLAFATRESRCSGGGPRPKIADIGI